MTEQDQKDIEQLTAPEQQARYHWDEDFQRMLLGMLLSDRFFLCQAIGLVKPNYFSNEIHQLACRTLLAYFEKQKNLPSRIFLKQEITDKLRERYQSQDVDTFAAVKLLYLGEITTVYDYYAKGGVADMMPGLDSTDAILDKILAFAKTQATKQAFHKSLELIRKNPESDETWGKVDEFLKQARMVERQTDIGLNYFESVEERYERMLHNVEAADLFTTGFVTIDRSLQGGGLCKGELGAWIGLPGQGKSLALVTAAVKNITRGKKVLYLSTEMDHDRIATRFDAQFSLVGQHQLLERKEEVWQILRNEVADYDDKRRLIIKQFPSGSADVNTVRAFHSQCVMWGFRPDLVIMDYPGDMKHRTDIPLYQSMQRILMELRGFGGEEGHCTLVAIQPNAKASELTVDQYIDESKQGDSFGQNRVLDAFWSLNQTPHEQKASVGRVFVAKARNGKSRYAFKIRYGFPTQTLTIEEISDELYRSLMNRVQEQAAEDVVIDNVVTGGVEARPPRRTFTPSDGERVS